MKRLRVLEAWLCSLVETYQDAHTRPRRTFGNLTHLAQPTQIYAISLKRRATHLSIFLVTHEPTVANGAVVALEFATLAELADFSDRADEVFGTDSIERESYPGLDHLMFPETKVAASACIHLAEWFRGEPAKATIKPGVTIYGQYIMAARNPGAYWQIVWKDQFPPPREFLSMISEARRRSKSVPTALTQSSDAPVYEPPKQLQIYGAFHEPAIWFGAPVRATSRQQVLKQIVVPSTTRHAVATGLVGGVNTCVTNDGQVVAFASDSVVALRTINQIFAVLSRSGVPSLAVSAGELLSIGGFNLFTGAITGSQSTLTPRNQRDSWFQPPVGQTSFSLPLESAAGALIVAHLCALDERKSVLSLRMYDAVTLFQRESFSEAFVVAWSVIEANAQHSFKEFWVASGRSKKKIQEMDWTASQQIDLLLAIGRIDKTQAEKIHDLRKVRNKVVHELHEATKLEAKLCIESAQSQSQLPALGDLHPKLVI